MIAVHEKAARSCKIMYNLVVGEKFSDTVCMHTTYWTVSSAQCARMMCSEVNDRHSNPLSIS